MGLTTFIYKQKNSHVENWGKFDPFGWKNAETMTCKDGINL